MLIQVLGTGCTKCTKLAETADEAAKQTGADNILEKVTGISRILDMGVMSAFTSVLPRLVARRRKMLKRIPG